MVRKLKTTPPARAWKALLATAVISGGLLWHILACLESPMAFSPDGKQLAFVTMEPYGDEGQDVVMAGAHCYRLMVLRDLKKLEVIEQTTEHLLTAPAWSPDGNRLCYLRIPLATPENLQDYEREVSKRKKLLERLESRRWGEPPTSRPASAPSAASAPSSQAGEETHSALPSVKPVSRSAEFFRTALTNPPVEASLVVRDAKTLKVVSVTRVDMPMGWVSMPAKGGDPDTGMDLLIGYTTIRPRYGPDGKWVYLCAGGVAMGIDPSSGSVRLLAAPTQVGSLSPDGKTLGVLQDHTVGFVRTDGTEAVYRRVSREAAISGLAWKDNQTIVLLTREEGKDGPVVAIEFLRRDGKPVASVPLDMGKDPGGPWTAQFAIAPNGKHYVVYFANRAMFLDAKGKVLKRWHAPDEGMAQPTFTPDSRHVAMKHMVNDDGKPRVVAIVLFTPEGKQVARAAVPRIKPGTTRPASRPATRPASRPAARPAAQ